MSFVLPDYLWEPQRRGVEATIAVLEQNKRACLYSPTGGGKTEQAIQLLRWAQHQGVGGIFFVNRKLLVSQTAERFQRAGLHYGIRAADYEDYYDINAPFQVSSADTERSRVYERKIWKLHEAGLVVVDEAHIQKSETMQHLLEDYRAMGAKIVLLTATPVGLSNLSDQLVVSGKLAEYRACKALVAAKTIGIGQPDLSKIKRSCTGEFVVDGKVRKQFVQHIVGNVLDRWKKFNPDARPTMAYWPGKDESIWGTEQFVNAGVNWCHVDANDAVVDGKRYKLTRKLWAEILERYRANDIKGLSSRFKLREGIDVPNTYCCLLATPIGSLASYIQTVGRVLRYSEETPDHVIVLDFGGNYLRLGSPNHDRPWERWWNLPEHVISEWNVNEIRDRKKPEPVCCAKCGCERTDPVAPCPNCGYESKIGRRHVVMEDGSTEIHDGDMIKPRKTQLRRNTAQEWERLYHSWLRSPKAKNKTFAQMAGFFAHKFHYHPPRDLPYMPREVDSWHRAISFVPTSELY